MMGNWSRPPPSGYDISVYDPAPAPMGIGRVLDLALDISGTCNLACAYCAERTTQPERPAMTPVVWEQAWRFLQSQPDPLPAAALRFGSGEPLLNLPALRGLANLARQNPDAPTRVEFCVTTNAMLADQEVRDFFVEAGFNVKVSLDGSPSNHDRFRNTRTGAPTGARATEVAADLAARIPERLSVSTVLCAGTDPLEVFNYVRELGVKRMELVPVSHPSDEFRPGPEDYEKYLSFIEGYARDMLESGPAANFPALIRFEKYVARVMGHFNSSVSCNAGRSYFGVGPDGALYPCFRFVGLKRYRLGTLDRGLDQRGVTDFQQGPGREFQRRPSCPSCWAAPLCGGPCLAVACHFGGEAQAPMPSNCFYEQADAYAAFEFVSAQRRQNPAQLLSFLPGLPALEF